MASPSERKYVNDSRAVVGYGDTQDLALNDLLDKLRTHERDIACDCPHKGEGCRPFLLPPAPLSFRIYWRTSDGKIRWKCSWGPGALEFECDRVRETEN